MAFVVKIARRSFPLTRVGRNFSSHSADKVDSAELLSLWAESAKAVEKVTPEQFRMMMSKPEVIELFKRPKMQRILEDLANGGPEAVTPHLSDPEVRRSAPKHSADSDWRIRHSCRSEPHSLNFRSG